MSKRLDYKKMRKNIPNRVRTASRSYWDIYWTDEFNFDKENEKTFGVTKFNPQTIIINSNQPDKETIHTMVHEYWHALSFTTEANLTETQVCKLEQGTPYLIEFIAELLKSSKRKKKK